MTAVMYGIRNCDTVKKARAWLESHGVAYDFHDYKTAGLSRALIERWCDELGWEVLLNRAGGFLWLIERECQLLVSAGSDHLRRV